MHLFFVIESGGKTFVSYEYFTAEARRARVETGGNEWKRVETAEHTAAEQLSRLSINILHSEATTKLESCRKNLKI